MMELSPTDSLENDGVFQAPSDAEAVDKEMMDSNCDDHNTRRAKPYLWLVVSVVSLGGLFYGLDLGAVGATFIMDDFRKHVDWDCDDDTTCGEEQLDKGLISFFFGIGATLGSVVNPYFAEKYGRRSSLILSTLVYAMGAVIQTYLPTMELLWTGRFFVGVGVGMLSMIAPVYVAECAPNHIRGTCGILYDLSTSFGIFLGSAANIWLKNWENGWRVAYGIGLPFALVLLLALILHTVPESPRWLAAQGREDELADALALLRHEDELEVVMETLQKEVREKHELGEASWKEVFSNNKQMRRRVLLGVFFFAVQQLCGSAAVLFYAPDILNIFFDESQAIRGTLALGLLGFVATAGAAYFVDKFGRTKLLVYGGITMFLCLVPLAIASSLEHSTTLGWIVLVCCSSFIVGMSLSWGPALYVLCSEMFPYRTRGKAAGVTSMSHWLFATIAGSAFPIAAAASLTACFAFFSMFILLGTAVVYFLQVETTGMSFDQIDEAFLLHQPTLKRKDW